MDASLHFGDKLSAGEQQTEFVLWRHGGGHDLNYDFSEGLCATLSRPSYTQGIR